MKKIQSVCSAASIPISFLELPFFIRSKISPFGLSYSDFISNITEHEGLFYTEILFLYCIPKKVWRFMGVSVNFIERDPEKGVHIEELVSSTFRTSPTEEIETPWSCILAFCETALCSKMGRIVSPYVHLVQNVHQQDSIVVPLDEFDYQTMTWTNEVKPFSIPA